MSKSDEILERFQDRLVRDKFSSEKHGDDSDVSDSELLQELEDDIEKDGFLDSYREKRLEQLLKDIKQAEKLLNEDPDSGALVEMLSEESIMKLASSAKNAVIHFYQPHFQTCAALNNKLAILARKHPVTRFVYINAQNSPFLITKWKITTLPCLVTTLNGKVTGKMVGLQHLNYNEKTGSLDASLLENYLYNVAALERKSLNIHSISKQESCSNTNNEEEDDDWFD